MRRSVEEGVNSRFVTGDRVQAVIKVSEAMTLTYPHFDQKNHHFSGNA